MVCERLDPRLHHAHVQGPDEPLDLRNTRGAHREGPKPAADQRDRPERRAGQLAADADRLAQAPGGRGDLIGNPIKFTETPVEYRRAPPTIGQDTDAVLDELLDLGPEDVAALRAKGVV